MIDVSAEQLAVIRAILDARVPGCKVLAFGSRANGRARKHSDLDLVVVGNTRLAFRTLAFLRADFEESTLPFRVEVLDWHRISESFRAVIDKSAVPLTLTGSG